MGVIPHVLFKALSEDLSDQLGPDFIKSCDLTSNTFWPGISFKEAAGVSLRSALLKKLQTRMTKATRAAALSKFLAVNSGCRDWEMQLENTWDETLINEVRKNLYDFWFQNGFSLVDHHFDILARGRLGPGSSIKGGGTDFYTKLFSSPLSCPTSELYFWYNRYIASFPEWRNAESIRLLNYGEAHITQDNRLDFVPKNDDISRSICVETSLGMFYQLGFAAILNSRLTDFFGINLEDQQFKNRELARRGSVDGSFATIDLSSASDSISVNMLRAMLPPQFLRWLLKLRSTHSILPDGKREELHMISTMGNGFTFPLQTILFSSIVRAAFSLHGLAPVYPRGVEWGNFGVNGDDIVVPTAISRSVLRALHLLGFSPNPAKTFVEGPFRESCGGDYFNGRNLRGVYIERLDKSQDLYAVINQLNLFSTRTGILLPKLVQTLTKKVKYLPVPCHEADDAGIRVPFSLIRNFKVDPDVQSIQYYARKPVVPLSLKIRESSLVIPPQFKSRIFNPSGLHICFLQRSVTDHRITPRDGRALYQTKRCVTPGWDNIPETHPLSGWFNWRRWNTSVYMNLFM
jgi:hypothetical protein